MLGEVAGGEVLVPLLLAFEPENHGSLKTKVASEQTSTYWTNLLESPLEL